MSKIKSIVIAIVGLCVILASQTAFAREDVFAASMADMYRVNTGADISIVTGADVLAAQNSQASLVTVKELGGDEIYEKISGLVSVGGESYPHMSGISVELKTTIDGGVRHDRVEKIFAGGTELERGMRYIVALGENASKLIGDGNVISTYTSDDAALYRYVADFGEKDKTETKPETTPKTEVQLEGNQILKNQTPVLVLALILLAAVIVLYFVLKKKRNQN